MSDHQKEAFAERLKRIERNPGNGRMVEPGAAETVSDAKKSTKKAKPKQIAKRVVYKKPRTGLGWLYGAVTGSVLFLAWLALYPAMSTPRAWALDALPVPPKVLGAWVAGIVVFGLALLRRMNLRLIFVMLIGMVMGAGVLALAAGLVPGLGATLTNETFAAQMQSMFAPFFEE